MVGIGYRDANPNQIEVYDTWNPGPHTMTWGGWYGGMKHDMVTVLHLVPEPCTLVPLCVVLLIGVIGYAQLLRR